VARRPLFAAAARLEGRLDAKAVYERLLGWLLAVCGLVTSRVDSGSLQRMLLLFLLTSLALGAVGLLGSGSPLTGGAAALPVDGASLLGAGGLVAVALASVALHRRRLTAVIVLGAVGLIVSLIFVKFSAPDLALTQLSVEVVTIILLLLALYFMPQRSPAESGLWRRLRDLGVAALAGVGAAALSWAVLSRPLDPISGYFLANSVPGGGGANVVNVILVDFRGYDTLGEITVLALAGLGIYGMLKDLSLQAPTLDAVGRAWDWDTHPTIMAALSRLLLPLTLLVSTFIFLRGHNQPGGGFIAGLITAIALIQQYLSNGVTWTQGRLSANMHPLIGAGLLIATLTGVASLTFGNPFLTSAFTHVHWPIVGDFELASALAFDLGVYLVVVGATLLILVHLGRIHGASHENPSTGSDP